MKFVKMISENIMTLAVKVVGLVMALTIVFTMGLRNFAYHSYPRIEYGRSIQFGLNTLVEIEVSKSLVMLLTTEKMFVPAHQSRNIRHW